jgi:energy-coupling factor transporter transmembrane protein EcfT
LHPLAWWLWSALLATTLVRLHNTWVTILAIAGLALIVRKYKSEGPWAMSFSWAIKLSLFVIAFRVFVGVVIGVPVPGHTLFSIPNIPLPHWMAGITLGGPVTWERLSGTFVESLNIAAIIAVFGAATSLTNPKSVLKSMPPIFYEVGVVLVIATTITPQLVTNLQRIRIAQKLRGISTSKFLSWRQIAMPLLEDSLARALDLAAAMDSRGYGYSRKRSKYRPQKFSFTDAAFVATSIAFLAVTL